MFHTQHVKHVLFGVISKFCTGNPLQNVLQSDETQTAVLVLCSRSEKTWNSIDIAHQSIGVSHTVSLNKLSGISIRRKTGRVGKKVYNADIHFLACFRVNPRLELRDIFVHLVLKSETALLKKVGHRHCSRSNFCK